MLEWKLLDLAVFFSTAQLIWSRRTDAILFTLVAVHRVIINGGGSPCTVAFLWRLHLELKLV